MSQPWRDASSTTARSGPSWAPPAAAEPADDAAGRAGSAPDPAAGDSRGNGGPTDRPRGQVAGPRHGPRLTGRGAITGMLLVFFIGTLAADWLHWGWLAGLSFLAGSAAAAWYTKQRDLLTIAVSPPLLFFIVLVCVKAITAAGNVALSTLEGTALTLANVAPWLFAGVLLALIIAWVRGLPRCVAELRRDLRPDLAQRRNAAADDADGTATVGGYQPAVKRYR